MTGGSQATLAVATIGYLVAREPCSGRVHSVFANACNVAVDATLLTILAARHDDAPTTLRLADGAPIDLSQLFAPDERVAVDREGLRTARTALRWRDARVWHRCASPPLAPAATIAARCRRARAQLARDAGRPASVLAGSARPLAVAWRDACADADGGAATRCIDRLLGLGEGLTPAGDDFLVGALAALDAFAARDSSRCEWRDGIARAIVDRLDRTTPISAHLLRLAGAGHHGATLLRLRDALLGERHGAMLDAALARALAIGSTSGADTVNGLLTTIAASLETEHASL